MWNESLVGTLWRAFPDSFWKSSTYFQYMCLTAIEGVSWVCDQNGDGVSKNDKSGHICSMSLEKVLIDYKKDGTLSIFIDF